MKKVLSNLFFVMAAAVFGFNSFVRVENGMFTLDGKPFRFVGSNCYYLHYKGNRMIDSVLESAKNMGITVLRVWGFLDGEKWCREKKTYMHSFPGIFGVPEGLKGVQDGFERLDYVVKKAGELGIKLIIVLTNNWDDFGGMSQYVKWFEGTHHDDFYRNEKIKEEYKKYVAYLINRVNTYTGVAYKDDPTIMAWELANEPRCETDKTGNTLLEWVREMSAYVKGLDPNHLVAVGDEGFFNGYEGFSPYAGEAAWTYNGWSGVDWKRLLLLETVDFGTFHLYPSHWGVSLENYAQWGAKWIEDHVKLAKSLGKPVVLEEYGIPKSANINRAVVYKLWNDLFYKLGGDGAMFWMLAGVGEGADRDKDGYYPDYDGFRIVDDGSEEVSVLKRYARLFATGEGVEENEVHFLTPDGSEIKERSPVQFVVFERFSRLTKLSFLVDDELLGSPVGTGYGVFRVMVDPSAIEKGEHVLKVIAEFEDGTVAKAQIRVKVN